MAVNKFTGKYSEGTFAGGEGPVLGQSITNEAETKGVLGTDNTTGRKLQQVNGTADSLKSKGEDKGFDIHGADYKGPQNWAPKDEGESHNFDIKNK
jgi:hypothetical protein